MRVLQVDVAVNTGSTGCIAEEIGLKVMQNCGESYIGYGRYARPSKSQTIKIGNRFDQAYHLLQTRLFDRHGFYSAVSTRSFIKKIEFINPDIIHLHQLHGYYINIEVLFTFLKAYKKPVVWTFHDCWQFTGHCCYFSRVDCEKWKTSCYECPLKRYYPQSLGLDNSKNNFKIKKELFNGLDNLTIVPVSNWLGNIVKDSFLKEQCIKVIPNGVDINVFRPLDASELKNRFQNKKIILGVASIWSDHKGLRDFHSIAKMINSNIQIILIGLNKKQIEELPQNIYGIERTENKSQLAEFYNIADVFVNPSISESFGLVTVESMACGTPVVVYNATASPELVTNETGIIVEKSDTNALLIAAMNIIEDGKEKYSDSCIRWAKKNYDKNVQFSKYIELYKNLLST